MGERIRIIQEKFDQDKANKTGKIQKTHS